MMDIERDRDEVIKTANSYHATIMVIKDYVEQRMQQIDELGDHFMKLEMYDDVRKADIEGRGNELVKIYEILRGNSSN